jgi:hypothetical protein
MESDMGLIPKTDSVEETEIKVTAAKEVHAARVEVETRLRTRLQAAGAQVEALTAAAGDASADIYLREASGETEEGVAMCRETAAKKIAELDAAKAEQIALQNALRIAEGQATDARLAVVRIQNRNHMVRVSKLLERMFNEVGRLELAIETSAESWKKINGHFETLVSCWPGDQNTLAMIAPRGATCSRDAMAPSRRCRPSSSAATSTPSRPEENSTACSACLARSRSCAR